MSTLLISHPAFLEHLTPLGHPERPDRLRAIERALEAEKFQTLERSQAPLASLETIALCHPMEYIVEVREAAPREGLIHLDADNDPGFGWTAVRLGDAVESLARTTSWLIGQLSKQPEAALAGASPYLRLFGLATGGCLLAKQALSMKRLGEDAAAGLATARFFAEHVAVAAGGLERTVVEGAAGVIDDAALTVA